MAHIVLSEEQVRVVAEAQELIELRDSGGKVLARIEPPALAAEIAEARRRLASDQPRIPAAQVRATMQALEEGAARGLTDAQLWELYDRLQSEARK